MMKAGKKKSPKRRRMPLSLNSSVSAHANSVTLSTTMAPCLIYVVVWDSGGNAPTDITGVTDTTGLNYIQRTAFGNMISFYAIANANLSSDVITLTTGSSDNFMSVFAVSGFNPGCPFDGHSGIPISGNALGVAQSISTSNPTDFIIGSYGNCDGAGAGWNQISLQDVGVQSFLVEYQIVPSAQSGLVVDAVNIRGSSDYLIDAIVASPPIPGHGGRGGRHRRGGAILKVMNTP